MIASEITTHYKLINKSWLTVVFIFISPLVIFSQNFWEEIYIPDSVSCHSILVDNTDSIYIGVSSNYSSALAGVYKSDLYGMNWHFKGPEGWPIQSIAQNNKDEIIIGSNSRIFKSIDQGNSWQVVYDSAFGNVTSILTIGGDTIFAGGWLGYIRSFNGGESWDTSIILSGVINFEGIVIDQHNNLYTAAFDFMSDSGGVFKSSDYGLTWEKKFAKDLTAISINSNNELFVTTLWDGIYSSSDTGETWFNINSTILDIMTVTINQDDHIFIGCQDLYFGGVLVSYDNGYTWNEINSGLTNQMVHSLYVDKNGFLYAINNSAFPNGSVHRSTKSTVGIDDATAEKIQVSVYPNPFNINIHVAFKAQSGERYSIKIFNSLGVLLLEDNLPGQKEFVRTYHLEHFPKGMYFIMLKEGNRVVSNKKIDRM